MGQHEARPDDNPFAVLFRVRAGRHPRETVPDWARRMEQRIMTEIDDLAAAVALLGGAVSDVESTLTTLEQEVAAAAGDTLDKQRVSQLTQTLRDDITRLSTSVAAAAPGSATSSGAGTDPASGSPTPATPSGSGDPAAGSSADGPAAADPGPAS